jgi:3-oxoacyl-[acyl-carrier-protein] synthase-1
LLAEVEARLKLGFRQARARQFADGTVGAFRAMAYARQLLAEGVAKDCLIIAVDSLMDTRSLHWLDSHQRLKKEGHPDGVVPGEAACVTLVASRPLLSSAVCVSGLGFGHETATVLNDDPLLGKGLASAVRGALAEAGLGMHEVAFRLSDVAGESYAFEELVLAQTRTMTITRSSQDLLHPASSIGDCGAANGLLQLAWAEQAMVRRYACGPVALAQASAPGGSRAAAILSDVQRRY